MPLHGQAKNKSSTVGVTEPTADLEMKTKILSRHLRSWSASEKELRWVYSRLGPFHAVKTIPWPLSTSILARLMSLSKKSSSSSSRSNNTLKSNLRVKSSKMVLLGCSSGDATRRSSLAYSQINSTMAIQMRPCPMEPGADQGPQLRELPMSKYLINWTHVLSSHTRTGKCRSRSSLGTIIRAP